MRIVALLVMVGLLFGGCAQSAIICGTKYEPYGLLNADEKKNPDIAYEVVWGNVFWGVVFVETVIAPIYFGGFSLFQPIGLRPKIKGAAPSLNQDCPKT